MRDEANKAGGVSAGVLGSRIDETAACREMSKTALLEAAERLRRRAHQLEALAYQTEHVRGEAEEMLWELVTSYRGRI